ncbi:MAG: hypothetical protein O9345_01885 [Burkholderiaceae bacterium]|nr:hypothetical protein [Burkholderiales bacterium]MCZ8336904.1 hypothetical protein [Burkholderiaceae bacterium]
MSATIVSTRFAAVAVAVVFEPPVDPVPVGGAVVVVVAVLDALPLPLLVGRGTPGIDVRDGAAVSVASVAVAAAIASGDGGAPLSNSPPQAVIDAAITVIAKVVRVSATAAFRVSWTGWRVSPVTMRRCSILSLCRCGVICVPPRPRPGDEAER